jgi:hypothetical protein
MLIGMGVASTNRTDKFWHTGSAEEYSSEEYVGWGVRAYARVWRSYLQAILNECYFWFCQCGNVIIYVIPHFMYSDIIVVWMWYSTEIWVIRSTTVLIHFDSMDFPSWKLGSFQLRAPSHNTAEDNQLGYTAFFKGRMQCIQDGYQ